MKLLNSLIIGGSVCCALTFSAFAQPAQQQTGQPAQQSQIAQKPNMQLAYYYYRHYPHRWYYYHRYGYGCRTVCNRWHCWRRCW